MILNETYDDIIERLNRYGLNEGVGNVSKAPKILLQLYGKIRSEIKKQLPNCKSCIVYDDVNYTNVFVVFITLNHKYDKNEINEYNRNNSFFKAGFSRSSSPFFNKSKFINLRFTYTIKVL